MKIIYLKYSKVIRRVILILSAQLIHVGDDENSKNVLKFLLNKSFS